VAARHVHCTDWEIDMSLWKARTARWCAAGLSCSLLAGCGGHAEREGGQHAAGEHAGRAEAAHAPHPADILHVDANLLRDLRLTTAPAELRPLADAIAALGDLRVDEELYAEIGSPVAARVTRLFAAPGDAVKPGQPLVELSSIGIGNTRALVSTTRTRLLLAEQRMARLRELATHQIVPDQELRTAEAELAQAQAEQAAAAHALGALGGARGAGAVLTLTSPLAGTVIDRDAVRGRLVDAEHRLFSVGDLRKLWLVAHVFERDALRVRVGAAARVAFAALPGQSFEGRVTRVASRVDPTSRTLDVRIELDNPAGLLRPGMSGTASLPTGDAAQQLVAVPVAAVQRLSERWVVFLPAAEAGDFRIREVGRGRELAGEVELLSGVRPGETVVVDGAFLLKAEADKVAGGHEHGHAH
jgi:cobalt-zinc-cadmium efflux system membrane fusion protein